MYPGSKTKISEVIDGTSNTILIAETRETAASVWIDGSSATVAARWLSLDPMANPPYGGNTVSINYKPYFSNVYGPTMAIDQLWGPSSQHTGGAHHLLADGSVRFINQSLDVNIYDALSTRATGEVVGEF
jgi:hypothetical protein